MRKPERKRSRPHFFKILLPFLNSQLLEIPKAFVKHLKGKVPGIVSLRAPSGNTWRVKLIRKGNALWFSNGWSTFVSDHSSEFGDLFVFKYRGHMRFNVQIFDKSACEKKSAVDAECSQKMSDLLDGQKAGKNVNENNASSSRPSTSKGVKRKASSKSDLLDGQKAEKNVNDNSASSLSPSTSRGVKRKASSVQFSVNSEVIILSDDSESEERVDGRKKCSASALLSQTRDANLSGKPGLHPGNHFLEKQVTDEQGLAVTKGHPLTSSESDSDGNKASNLMSVSRALDTDTPILVHHMKKYNIHGTRILAIPSSFYHRYISFFRNRANFVLRTPDGASYTVKLVKSYRERRVLSAGWSSFIRHNSIEVGDACVLKFVGGSLIQVHIIKKRELEQVREQIF